MKIAISIEPYLDAEKEKLTAYIEKIVALAAENPQIELHFDYFKTNMRVVELLRKYCQKIKIGVHLMQPQILPSDFKQIAISVEKFGQQPNANGIVFDLEQPIAGYEKLIAENNEIIIMSVKCGKSGQTFNPSALDLIPKIRAINPQATITIDGGVNESNIEMVKSAGIDVAVVGNYAKNAYETGDLEKSINRLLRV